MEHSWYYSFLFTVIIPLIAVQYLTTNLTFIPITMCLQQAVKQ